jgi:ribonuclease HII
MTKKSKPKQLGKRELKRLQNLCSFEEEARRQGFQRIAGVDEAGRGPLAGPVVAGACLIPPDVFLPGIDDSKKLTLDEREHLYQLITSHPNIHYAVGIIDHEMIDKVNIYRATLLAMIEAVNKLPVQPDYLLVDGMKLPHPTIPSRGIIKGDNLSQSIAAGAILAKVTRDRIMNEMHTQYPDYGFDKHKGYSTEKHLEMLSKLGPSPVHRKTFGPCVTNFQIDLFEGVQID